MLDITGKAIKVGNTLVDNNNFTYEVILINDVMFAKSLRENNRHYELYRERIERNGFKIIWTEQEFGLIMKGDILNV